MEALKHRQDNIKMYLKEVAWHDADWIYVADLWRVPANKVTTFNTRGLS